MAQGVNKVILIGNLGDEPTVRQTQSGTKVANCSLATSDSYKDQQGNVVDNTEWHRLVFWGKLADIVSSYCHKGSKIFVEGKIQSRQYEDKKDGIKRIAYEIIVNEMTMLDSKPANSNNQTNNNYGGNNNNRNNNAYGNNNAMPQGNNNYGTQNSYGQNSYGNAPQQNVNAMPQRSYQPQNVQPVTQQQNSQPQQYNGDELPF